MCLLTFGKKIKTFKKSKIKTLKNKKIKKFKKSKKIFLDPQHIIFSLNFAR
jgi:hypothetical protein